VPISTIPEIIEDIRLGKMVILMDDEDRENEGDLIIAAEAVTPEIINFFASEACGLICMPITAERAAALNIPLMVKQNRSQHETNFTVSIDAAERLGPGISAVQRAHTIKVACSDSVQPSDIIQPGHIFPLIAKPGGVLRRAGHTEAGVDLARLAGFEPAAVIVEIMNEDGTMARRPQLEVYADKWGLKMGTIADLIEYRALYEHSIELVTQKEIDTEFGPFTLYAFKDIIDNALHYVLKRGDVASEDPVLVRVQAINPLRDLIGTTLPDQTPGWSYRRCLAKIAQEGRGILVLLDEQAPQERLIDDIESYPNARPSSSYDESGRQNYRLIGTGAQILQFLGVTKMRAMSAPIHYNALSGFNLEVVEFVEAESP
jgi:3,4-dihydroxy 2-butanone 4-phosphate synthase / GTP cyclohydrolase II